MSSRRNYPNPPIQEVLIQVAVQPGSLGNAAVPGQLYERVRKEYPADIQSEMQVQLPIGPSDPTSSGPLALRQFARYLFAGQEDNKKLILGSDSLSTNALPPYEGWEALLDRFSRAASALFDARPELSGRMLSIRYINKINIPKLLVNTDDYFTIPVRTAEEGTAPFSRFSVIVESVLTEDPIACTTNFSSGEPSATGLNYTIDIELSRPIDETVARVPTDWLPLLEDLHRRENLEFESIITDECRRLFKP